jgi:hypothetical protein
MAIIHYIVTASERGETDVENFTKTYCKTAVGFVLDGSVDDVALTEGEANTEYAAVAADGSPYSVVSKISVDDMGMTTVVEQKTV